MTLDQIRQLALSFPAVTEDIKWEEHLCFNVGKKLFLITAPDAIPISASFKAADDEVEEILSRPGFSKQPHLARYAWVHVDDIARLRKEEGRQLITSSFRLISSKLPKKLQKELGLE